MIHRLQTYMIAVSAALTIALASGVARGSNCGDPKPGWLHADRIAELESIENPTAKELYHLGSRHIKMGLFYDIAATSSAYLTVQAAQCYSEDPVQVWGAEYFGALALFELERISDADAVAIAGAQRSGGPAELVALSRLLGRVSGLKSSGDHPFSLIELEPRSYWDSLEASFRIGTAAGKPLPAFPETDLRVDSASGVTFTPLVSRLRLSGHLANGNIAELRRALHRFNSEGLPKWEVSTERGTAIFADPPLIRLAAEAHFTVAAYDLARGLQTAGLSNGELRQNLIYKLSKASYLLGDVERIENALEYADDKAVLSIYRGWVAWKKGETDAARELWKPCMDPDNFRLASDLLRIWAGDMSLKQDASDLVENMVASLGDGRDYTKLRFSKEGQSRVATVNSAIGYWYFRAEIYDSASYYFRRARPTSQPVCLRYYPAVFCAEYFAARTFSGMIDRRQEGYEGWLYLADYYAPAYCVLEPLDVVLRCERKTYLER